MNLCNRPDDLSTALGEPILQTVGELMEAGSSPSLAFWVYGAMFALLVALLILQVVRWCIRRSPRSRSYQLVAEAAGDPVFEIDLLSRRLVWSNIDGLVRMGFDGEDRLQIGTDFDSVHPDDREELRDGWDRLARNEKLDIQIRLKARGGGWTWCQVNAVPLKNRENRASRAFGVMHHTNDVHERQETLAEARRLETVGTIAGGIAHEFNNQLTPIRGYLELAIEDLEPQHPCRDGLVIALERVVHCAELVSQIQAYGRKSLMVLEPVHLEDELAKIADMVSELDRKSGATIRLVQEWPELLPAIDLDNGQFGKALRHLVRNAVEAMPNGGTIRVEAGIVEIKETDCYGQRDATPGRRVRLRIADTGIGIATEHLHQVMDPFFTTHGRACARGMGLPMVHGMMAQLGGWLDVRSKKGSGTTVDLYFPVSHAASEPAPRIPDGTLPVRAAAEQGRILLADDEVFIREIVRTVFEAEQWVVDEAADFNEVITRCSSREGKPYDLVVLDLTMPGPTAEETIDVLRATSPSTRVLLISGFSRDRRIDAMARMEGVDFIGKPFATKDLLLKVDEMMTIPPVPILAAAATP